MLLAAGGGGELLVRCASAAGRLASQVEDTRMPFLIRLLVNAAALWVATRIVTGVTYTGALLPLIGVALVFGLVNAIIRPILKFLTFLLFIVTFGLFALVLNGLMLMLTSAISSVLG